MSRSNRRQFLNQIGSAAIAIPTLSRSGLDPVQSPASFQATGASPGGPASAIYDLLIAGGRVVDPAQKLSAVSDVAIAGGRIARIAANIPPAQARQVFDATGKLGTPGLIDLHTHVYQYGISLGVDSDVVGFQSGVTTVLDCGSAGAGTFAGFRKYVIDRAATRIYALLNISTIGLVVLNEIYLDPRMVDARAAIRTIGMNRDRILGIKVRINGKHSDLAHDIEVLKTAREASDATGVPIMLHWTDEPDLLAILKKGDILAHPFNPPSQNSANLFGADGTQAEKVLPQILALKDRGIWTDGQLATTHHSWEISEKATKQGWYPDSISTDISRTPDGAPASVLVPMSEFVHLGMPVDQVIAGVTANPAKMINFPEKVGTLVPGVTADVAVLELKDGPFEFNDGARQTRTLKQQFVAAATVKGGIFLKGAPPAAPAGRGATPPASGSVR